MKNRKTIQGCPYCVNKKVLIGYNDLKSQAPELAKEWDYEKNGDLLPEMFTKFSHKKVWWKCKNGHSWITSVYNRQKTNCPYCNGRVAITGVNDLATLHPELLEEWDYERNTEYKPNEIKTSSNIPIWWRCKLGHIWKTSPNHRTRKGKGTGCPVCANRKVLAGFNDLKSLFPKIAESWDYEKNGDLLPEMFTKFSHKKVWWKCDKGHSWLTSISNRTHQKHGCHYCNRQKIIANENDLCSVDPKLASEWDYEKNGTLTPDQVMAGSSKKVWWKCDKGHSWQAAVYSRKYHGCPICSGKMAEFGVNDLKTLMPELAQEWDYEKNKGLRPEDVTVQSNLKVWWRCKKGHSWRATICERYNGNKCGICDGRVKMKTHFI